MLGFVYIVYVSVQHKKGARGDEAENRLRFLAKRTYTGAQTKTGSVKFHCFRTLQPVSGVSAYLLLATVMYSM